jgi:uncharacterized protein involved in exopolysaccharide biosynthesis
VNAIERYLFHLQRWWWLVLVVSLLAGAVSFLIASATSGSYAATATLLISVDSSSPLDDVAAGGWPRPTPS